MFGANYLATRGRLAELVSAIVALGRRSRAELAEADEEVLERALRRPFRIVVCGEGGAGKTSFLELLMGRELVDLEERARGASEVVIYRDVANRVRDERESACEKRYLDRFRDYELVDSTGVGGLSVDERAGLRYLIEGADFVFWVLPAENPWAAGTWDLVTEMREAVGGCSAVILQQVDRREAGDIPLLLGHLRDLCLQRVGHSLPIFPVSAKLGMAAGSGDGRDEKRWVASGFGECVSALDDFLNESAKRKRWMREAYDQAGLMLFRIEEHIDIRSRSLVSDQQYLQSIEADFDRLREGEVQGRLRQIGWLGDILEARFGKVMRMAKGHLGGLKSLISLFGRGDGAFTIERFLLDQVIEEAEQRGREQALAMLAGCRAKWGEMRPAMEERLVLDVGEFREDVFGVAVDDFSEDLVKALRREMTLMKLRGLLDRMMVRRQLKMRRFLLWSLSALSVGGFLGFFGMLYDPLGALGFVGVGIAFFFTMWGYGMKTRRAIVGSFAETLHDARPVLIDGMREGYVDMVREFFNGFTPMFESMRRKIADAQLDLEPQMKSGGELYLALKAVEQEL